MPRTWLGLHAGIYRTDVTNGPDLDSRVGPQDEATADLLESASARADDAVSLFEFTRRLNERLDETQKLRVLEMMWRVAHADGRIDKHEEHLLRRVADLLHLTHADFVRLRHATAND